MLRDILKYGVIAGLIVGILMAATIPLVRNTPAEPYGMAIGYTTMLIALSTIFVAIKRRRDAQGGVIRFWPAFALGLGISVVAGIIYVIAWDIMLPLLPGDFMGELIADMVETEKAKGLSGEALAKLTADMEQFRRDYANPLYRWPITFTEVFPVGVLVSLVSALVLRNPRVLPARATA